MFITLEGIDGSGTTTQVQRLADALRALGKTVTTTCEPSDEPIGRMIREALQRRVLQHGPEGPDPSMLALLFAADRIDHLRRVVEPALARQEIVISDRYVHSSLAYQGALLDARWVDAINAGARKADLVFWLDVPVDDALQRVASRGEATEIFEQKDVLLAVKGRYEHAIHLRPERVIRIDGAGTVERVSERLVAAVLRHLEGAEKQSTREPCPR